MNNLKNTIWNKRLPSFIGVLFLAISIGTIGWLSSNAVLFGTKAAVANTPKNVLISNITDTSFTVIYETGERVEGSIQYGNGGQSLSQIAFDDRDKSNGSPAKHAVHHLTVNNLKASTNYFFSITSGDKNFINNDKPYEVMTAANPFSGGMKIIGNVILDNGDIPFETVAYVTANNSQIISSLVDSKGRYEINMPITDRILSLQISDSVLRSKVSFFPKQSSTVPLIILSKDYDFTINDEPLEPSPSASESATLTPVAFPTIEGSTTTKPQIISPEKDQQFKDQQPLFRGTATPGSEVEITIESAEPIETTVKASGNGNWQYRPDTKLLPGTHTITIKTVDASGIVRTITQSFVVFAEGSEFTEPSVSPTPIKSGPTANPTTVPTATTAPTIAPTATPRPKADQPLAETPSVSQVPIPVTGNTSLVVTIIGIASTVGIGALLFFLTAL